MFRVALFLLLSWAAFCGASHAGTSVVAVHLQTYVELQSDVLHRAQHEASNIFKQAGIELRWTSDGHLEGNEVTHVNLVILPDKMARKLRSGFDQFGLAISGDRAYIFFDRLAQFAKEEMVSISQLLGPVIAHEIGHLLLGPNSHFTVGIMHGRWRKAEVKHALMGSLVFTPDQGKVMREDVRERMRDENAIKSAAESASSTSRPLPSTSVPSHRQISPRPRTGE